MQGLNPYDYRPRQDVPTSTLALASYLTWKQVDVLVFLGGYLVECGDRITDLANMSQAMTEMLVEDLATGYTPRYYGVSREALRATLKTLERRGLVMAVAGGWTLTTKGEQVANDYV